MDKLIQDLKRHKETLPVIKYDKKTKHIGVKCGFNCGLIPVKIIARRDLWLKWYHYFSQINFFDIINNIDKLTLKPYLSRPSKKTRKALEQYVKDDPQGFTGDMLDCVLLSLTENPLYPPATKSRKLEYKKLSWTKKNEMINISIRLHDYLYEIRNQKEFDRPAYLKKFLKAHKIEKYDLQSRDDIKDVVRRVMSEYYKVDFKERFWQTFVIEGPISINQVRKLSPNPNPENDDFLKELFKKFM